MNNYKKLSILFVAILLYSIISFPGYADDLDIALQTDANQLVQNNKSIAFTAVQISILLPSESRPRDYVAGTQTNLLGTVHPATTNMLVQYGSITKEYTNALLIKYIDTHPDSNISLQTSLATLFPEKFSSHMWPEAWKIITIEQLMNMTSGIANGYPRTLVSFNPDAHYTLDSYVQEVATEQNTKGCILDNGCFPAGTQFYYSNTNYQILGMIIGKFYDDGHEPYDDAYATALNENILDAQRAQGNAIYYQLYYTPAILNNMINSYWGFDNQSTPYLQFGQNITNSNLSWVASAGAFTGNMHALVNITHALFYDEILSAEQTQILTQTGFVQKQTGKPVAFADRYEQCTQTCYGLGVMYISQFTSSVYGDIYLYNGATQGFNSIYIWLPKYNVIIAVAINTTQESIRQPYEAMKAAIIQQVIAYLNPNQAVPSVPENILHELNNNYSNKGQ